MYNVYTLPFKCDDKSSLKYGIKRCSFNDEQKVDILFKKKKNY